MSFLPPDTRWCVGCLMDHPVTGEIAGQPVVECPRVPPGMIYGVPEEYRAQAINVVRDAIWPSKMMQQPDGSFLPVLPSPEAINSALRILDYPPITADVIRRAIEIVSEGENTPEES